MVITDELFKLQDLTYRDFQANLVPNIDIESIIGIRVPVLRKFAKGVAKDEAAITFLDDLPHTYYDENLFHSVLLSMVKDYDSCVQWVDKFLPYVDNWAVCDILAPSVFKKNKEKLIVKIIEWSGSDKPYTCRFGIEMLMAHFLDDDFKAEYLEIPAKVKSDEYYVNMMIAWFFATALAKQWDATVPYITENRFDKWVHNKTIQKAVESYRITDEQKAFLKGLRRK